MTTPTTTRLDHPAGCPRCGAELTELQALFGWACDACQRRARKTNRHSRLRGDL